MKILLTNDDGYGAKGLKALIKELSKSHNLVVIAPDREQSGVSHSLTFFDPLRFKKIRGKGKCKIYSTNGTPTDCVILGVKHITEKAKPDLIISGINHGSNLGDDISYSGTAAAAKEGTLQGIPSIAISLCSFDKEADFTFAAKFASLMADRLVNYRMPERMFFNINVPDVREGEIKGISITVQGRSTYKSWIEKNLDPRKRPMYWIGADLPSGNMDENTDFKAISENKVSITPVRLDLTDRNFIKAHGEFCENLFRLEKL
ncbi:MAG: 5'/3'-nucleotidase SurE [Candidatus Eremiobacterota bacterium]